MIYDDIEFIDFRNRHSICCRRQEFVSKNQHWHAYYEVEIAISGNGKHVLNGTEYKDEEGYVSLLRLGDIHGFDMENASEHWVIEIPPAILPDEATKFMALVDGNITVKLNAEDFKRVKELFFMIEEGNEKNDAFNEQMKIQLSCSLILFLLSRTEKNFSKRCTEKNIQIREIIAYIQDNLFGDLSEATIASKFFISKEYLCSFFKKNTGITLGSYIRKARLNYAAKLVVTTDKKMLDVCELSGFNSLPTFLRGFKKEFGMSPSEMRQNFLNKEKRGE